MLRFVSFGWLVAAVFLMEHGSVEFFLSVGLNSVYGIWADIKELSNVRSNDKPSVH